MFNTITAVRTAGKCVSLILHPSLTAGDAIKHVAKEAGLIDIQVRFCFFDQMFGQKGGAHRHSG